MLVKTPLALCVLLAALALSTVNAQVPRYADTGVGNASDPFANQPFSEYDQRLASQGAGAPGGIVYKFPTAMQIQKRPPLMPAKPQLVAPADTKAQQTIDALQLRQKETSKKIEAARQRNDFEAVARLVVTLDELRQERLLFLRAVAERVVPEKPESPDGGLGDPTSAPVTRPILPIPELAPKKNTD
jgi:hypothetical protein